MERAIITESRLRVGSLTIKQIKFCESYISTRNATQSSLEAGYSQSYSKSKAYGLLKNTEIQAKIKELESEYNQNHFKKLSLIANTELENILVNSENDSAKLKAIELVYKLSGVIQDDKISLHINNTNIQENKVLTINDFYEDVNDTLDEFYIED